jgi:hypothetical protein
MSSICIDSLSFVGLLSGVAMVGAARPSPAQAAQTGAKVGDGLKLSSDCNFLLIFKRKWGGFDQNRLVRI